MDDGEFTQESQGCVSSTSWMFDGRHTQDKLKNSCT